MLKDLTVAKRQRIRSQDLIFAMIRFLVGGRLCGSLIDVRTPGLVEVLKKKMSTTDALKLGIKGGVRIFDEPLMSRIPIG